MPVEITEKELKAALPDLTSPMRLAGLDAPVEVYRDRWGIPHIRAGDEPDLFFAQGFVTAQDRLWHMDFDRHRALGRWAEFAGPDGVAQDRLLRAAGMGRTAKLDYEAAGAEATAMVDAYTAGVNAFLDVCEALPVEYTILDAVPERWENWHCLAVYKMRNTLLGTFEPKLFRTRLVKAIGPERAAELMVGYPRGHLLTVPPGAIYDGPALDGLKELSRAAEAADWLDEVDAGSNGWAISGMLTQSGLPLIAGDSHRALDTPSVYYQVHLSCPDFSAIGHSVPGMPGAMHFCHNAYVGWGMTHGGADTQDLFIERFREGRNGREYEFRGEWRPAEVLQETIGVRGADPVEMEVTITHHGPVVAGDAASGLAVTVSDPGLIGGSQWTDAVRDAMRSKSLEELHGAFRNWVDRVNNYAVADVHGNFGYLHEGRIPIRPESNGWRAVPGWTGEHEWEGYIPHDELPKAVNPDTGYVVTCNQRVADHDYPYYVGFVFAPEYRARRIQTQILELRPGTATVADMARIHAERMSIPARVFTRALIRVAPLDEGSERALSLLRSWHYLMDRDLAQPSIYAAAKMHLLRRLIAHWTGDLADEVLANAAGSAAFVRQVYPAVVSAIERGDCSLLPSGQGWAEALAEALRRAVADLREELGEDMSAWQWGRLHRTRPRHPLSSLFPECAEALDPPPMPVHGDGDTPLAGSYGLDGYTAAGLSVNRYIHDPSDWTKSRWIVPLGSSGNPGSPHYADQAETWADVAYIPQLWDWDEIAAEAESCQRLEPDPSPSPSPGGRGEQEAGSIHGFGGDDMGDGRTSGLCGCNPVWDRTRAERDADYVYEDEDVLIATDFECACGTNFRRDGEGYALDLEPEPGDHRYSGMSYYYCFGVKSKRGGARRLRVRVHGQMLGKFAADQAHAVLRRGERWFHLEPESVRGIPDTEILELDLPLPGADEPDPVLFVSNFHWHPYSELKLYLDGIAKHPEARVSGIGASVAGRPLYRVEIGPDSPDAPHIVVAQTPQPSEMGTWTCRAVIDFLLSDTEAARSIRSRHRFTILPATNPDGTVLGLGVSHPLGRFPYFEGKETAEEDPDALPEMAAVWNLLVEARPWLFIEWHSNNWNRRPGHMLLRFRPHLMADEARRRVWEEFDGRLMRLPDTYHGNWTAHDEGMYQNSLCFQAITRLGCIAHMIKHHDKFPLQQSCDHAVMCVREAVGAWESVMG